VEAFAVWDYQGFQRSKNNPIVLEKVELKNKNGITIVSSTPRILPLGVNFFTKLDPNGKFSGASFGDLIYQSGIDTESSEKNHLLDADPYLKRGLSPSWEFTLPEFINKYLSPFPYSFTPRDRSPWKLIEKDQIARTGIKLATKSSSEEGSIVRSLIKLAPTPKGGDQLKFYAIMGCENYAFTTTPNNKVPVVPFVTTVRTITDGKMEVKSEVGNISYQTKELKGFINGNLLNDESSAKCLVGTTVFDADGHIVGVVTDYTYSDLPSVDNLTIASIYDERVARLLNHYYLMADNYDFRHNHLSVPSSKPLDMKWKATSPDAQYDPAFVADLEQNFNKYVIENTWARQQCDRTIKMDQEFDLQTQKFNDILKLKNLRTQKLSRPVITNAYLRAQTALSQRRMVCQAKQKIGL
jgi:hypothetical protein